MSEVSSEGYPNSNCNSASVYWPGKNSYHEHLSLARCGPITMSAYALEAESGTLSSTWISQGTNATNHRSQTTLWTQFFSQSSSVISPSVSISTCIRTSSSPFLSIQSVFSASSAQPVGDSRFSLKNCSHGRRYRMRLHRLGRPKPAQEEQRARPQCYPRRGPRHHAQICQQVCRQW
jgi:hypothetical protein